MLAKLLEETHETYYWLGFLMADGYFSDKNRLQIVISDKDKEHLEKLQRFLGIAKMSSREVKSKTYVGLAVQSKEIIGAVKEKFKIFGKKTYNPCDISAITNEDLLFCLGVGFIDGDGCIQYQHKRKHPKLTIKCHSSWLDNIITMFPSAKTIINAAGYAEAKITEIEILKVMKKRAESLGLPLLERKWNHIDPNFESIQQKTKDNIPIIKTLLAAGFTQAVICKSLGYEASSLCGIIKRNNLQ